MSSDQRYRASMRELGIVAAGFCPCGSLVAHRLTPACDAGVSTSLPAEAVASRDPLDLDALEEHALRTGMIALAEGLALIERVRALESVNDDFHERVANFDKTIRMVLNERDEANARAATILQETTAALQVVRAEHDRVRAERDELRAAVERVRAVIERVANDALLYGWADGQGRTDEPILFTVWAKERAEKEVQALRATLDEATR